VILLPPQGAVYSFILEVKGYPAQLTSLAIGIGLLWLRRRRPDLRRPFRAWKIAVYLPIGLSCALLLAPFFPPSDGQGEFVFWYGTYALVGIGTVIIAVSYWWVWIRVLPWIGGYGYAEDMDELSDGTKISRLVRVRNDITYTAVDDEEEEEDSVRGDVASKKNKELELKVKIGERKIRG
jgi:amino acid transporter